MEIKAKIKHDLEAEKALYHLCVYKKADPKKRFRFSVILRSFALFLLVLDLLIIGYFEIAYGIESNYKGLLIGFVIFIAFSIAVTIWSYCYYPKVLYCSLGKMKDLVDEYSFGDESFTDEVNSEEYREKTELPYTFLFKVYETSKYFFLFRNKTQVYVVDKATFEGGTCEELREKLMFYVGENYTICDY